ncbi:type VII secretion target [Prescottella defluvii]|uniref:type VII secretion target n=1 Tax=Prescottella defluvii TaxID=1323361 RepID=UPI0004F35A38|nr:type VII secretion target [Prescottella defluvii]
MDGFTAAPDEIRAYGDIAAQTAAHIGAAGAFDAAADVAALTPVFGVIGADFLATFAATRVTHAKSVAALANVYAGTSSVAHTVAAAYDTTDRATGAVLGAARDTLGGNA